MDRLSLKELKGSTCNNLVKLVTSPCAGERIVGIAAGAHHSLAVSDAGRVFTWGRTGRLGHAPLPGSRARDEFAPRLVRAHMHAYICAFAVGAQRGRAACVCCAAHLCTVRLWRLQTCVDVGAGLCRF